MADDVTGDPRITANFCAYCGMARASAASSFCASCGSQFVGMPQPADTLQASAIRDRNAIPNHPRNGGNVAWGAFWGFMFWPSILVMMLSMPKGAKREDRVFGYWIGVAAPLLIGLVIGLIVVVASPESGSSTARPGAGRTEVPQLLTREEAISIASDSAKYGLTAGVSGAYFYKCPSARYEPGDRKWAVTCEFRRADSDVSPFQTKTYVVDDRTGKIAR